MTRGQPSPPLLTPSGGRVPSCPWGSYRPSQVGGTAPSPAGGREPLGPGGRGSPSGRGACASAAPSRTGPRPAWRRQRCAASSTRMAWRVASPRAGRGPTVSRAAPVGVGSGVGVGHRHGRGAPLAGAQAALGRAPAHLERDRLPGPRGGSRPAHTGSARCGAGPPACGNGVREVDAEPSRHAGQAPWVGVLPRPPRVHDGGLQGAGPVAWLPAHQVRCRTPLDG